MNLFQDITASRGMQRAVAQNQSKSISWLASRITAGALIIAVQPALAIQFYDITLVGLYDAGHTRSDGYKNNQVEFLNAAGQVEGRANRYSGAAFAGYSAWLYNGSSTQEIGLTDAGHTRNDGLQYNQGVALNAFGQVAGSTNRYSGSTGTGNSAWFYNGSSTQEIGLTDAGHTNSTTGYQSNIAKFLNNAGRVAGTANRYSGSTGTGISAWLYNGTSTYEIGLTDAGHTRNTTGERWTDVIALNAAGQVAGVANRYNGSSNIGQSAWFYNGNSSQEIGLIGAEHTRNDGIQYNVAKLLNNAGQVAGEATRYSGTSNAGGSAWIFNGSSTQKIGLTDAGHTSTDGWQLNHVEILNTAGQVVGSAARYNGPSTSFSFGQSAWLYNGSSTQEIGLTDAGHTRTDGYQYNQAQALNDAGQVAGMASRFSGTTDTGWSAWLYNGTSTHEIGLTDAGHTRTDGYQSNSVAALNAAGQVAGMASRFSGTTGTGSSAWFFDPTLNQTFMMNESVSTLTGEAFSAISFLGDDGLALGYYTLYNVGGTSLGYRAFSFTVTDGWNDLGSMVDGGLNAAGWNYLASAYRANGAGQIIGNGVLAGMSGQAAYLLTPVPEPETWAMLLAGLGLVGFMTQRRKQAEARVKQNCRITALTAGLVGALLSCAAAAAPSNVGGRSSPDAYTGSQNIQPGADTVSLSAGDSSTGFDASLTLSTGQLHVDARSSAGTWSQGWATINDTIHIGGALPTSVNGTLTLTVDGEITNGGSDPSIGIVNYGYAFASLGAGTGLSNSVHQSFFVSNDCTGLTSCSLGGAFSDSIIIPFTVDDQHRNVYIQAGLDGNAYFGARTNFFNTGTLSIQLQPGLTFTSASGLLLTASPAPEPSTYALLGAGLLVIALRVKSKSAALHKQCGCEDFTAGDFHDT